ncbi:MAG TPA: hypothetical protein VGL39_00320 [Jatrophihabitantaceae bacterium]|jgi:hypothetical protein
MAAAFTMAAQAADAEPTVPSTPACTKHQGFEGCNRPNRVEIGGAARHGSKPSKTGGHGAGAIVEPAGSVRLVGCGADIGGRLQALGDRAAALDAQGCSTGKAGCDQTAQATGKPHRNFVRVVKQADGTWSLTGAECRAVAGPPQVTPQMVWEQASRMIPPAAIGLAPHENTLVNIQTIMWVDTAAARNLPTVAILGQQVSIDIKIDHVDWNFGDEKSDTSNGPGKAYDAHGDPCKDKQCPDYYGHTYATTGDMTVTATVTWRATFRVGAGAVTAIPGTIPGPTTNAAILVREARSVLVPGSR